MKMFKSQIAAAALAASILAVLFMFAVTVNFGYAQESSNTSDSCGLICKNLKEDWNYLFHPERVNQCRPRQVKPDPNLENLSKQAFTRDDPSIPRYCGSPFTPR